MRGRIQGPQTWIHRVSNPGPSGLKSSVLPLDQAHYVDLIGTVLVLSLVLSGSCSIYKCLLCVSPLAWGHIPPLSGPWDQDGPEGLSRMEPLYTAPGRTWVYAPLYRSRKLAGVWSHLGPFQQQDLLHPVTPRIHILLCNYVYMNTVNKTTKVVTHEHPRLNSSNITKKLIEFLLQNVRWIKSSLSFGDYMYLSSEVLKVFTL